MGTAVTIGDYSLHIIIRTLIRGIEYSDDPIPDITEIHVADAIVLVCIQVVARTVVLYIHNDASSCRRFVNGILVIS
jgi:hypothetical protein